MQQNTARMVMLTDSSGKKYTAQSTTAYNQVYTIEKPKQGKWLLSFPVYTGAHSFIAKAHGDKNVEFVTYFMHQERPDGPVLAIANPLKGNELLLDKNIYNSSKAYNIKQMSENIYNKKPKFGMKMRHSLHGKFYRSNF